MLFRYKSFIAFGTTVKNSFLWIKREVFTHPLFFIVILGFCLRIYRLEHQSIWMDELPSHLALSNTTWTDFYAIFKFMIPEHTSAPVFYVLLYMWSKIAGMNPLLLRLLPVTIGTASIVLTYFLGHKLYSRRIGLLSALFVALSPTQIWLSQELRVYALLLFLSLSSLLTLEIALSSSKRRFLLWTLYYLVTALCIFNHLFSILILVPQGLYVLLRRGFPNFVLWSIPGTLCAGLLLFVTFNIPHTTEFIHNPSPTPEITTTLLKIIGKDVINIRWHYQSPWYNNPPYMSNTFLSFLVNGHQALDFLILAAICLSLFLFLVFNLKSILKKGLLPEVEEYHPSEGSITSDANGNEKFFNKQRCAKVTLIFSLIFVPSIILAFLEGFTKRPFFLPAYDSYNMIAVYIAVSVVISKANKAWFYKLSILLIFFFYGYQCLLFLPYGTRPDWKGATEYIEENSHSHDLIIDEWSLAPGSRLYYYLEHFSSRKRNAVSLGDVCAQTIKFLEEQNNDDNDLPAVWIISDPVFLSFFLHTRKDPRELLSDTLNNCGLTVDTKYFPGGSHVTVFRVTKTETQELYHPDCFTELLEVADYKRFWNDVGITPEDGDEENSLIAAFQRSVGLWPPSFTHTIIQQGFSFLRYKEYRLATAFGKYLLRTNPYYGLGYYYMGTLLALAGERERAEAYFTQAFTLYPIVESYSGDFSRQLCSQGGVLPDEQARERLFSFPYQLFVDLERYLEETAVPDPLDRSQRMIPEEERVLLAAELADGEALIEAICLNQTSLAVTEAWLPITRRLPGLWAEGAYLAGCNAETAAEKYKALIARYPFDRLFYERFDYFLQQEASASVYVSNWLELIAVNPDLSTYAAQKIEETGHTWLKEDRKADALIAFEAALSFGSDHIDVADKAGKLYALEHRPKEALARYGEVLKKEPYYSDALKSVDALLAAIDDKNFVLHYWEDLYASNSTHWEVAQRYGAILEETEHFSEASEVFLSFKEDEEHACTALLAAVRCLRLSGNYRAALSELNALNPERCDPPRLVSYEYLTLGQTLMEAGNLDSSSSCFKKALNIGGFDSLAYFNLAMIAQKGEDPAETLHYLEKSVAADPENLWHRQVLVQEQIQARLWEDALNTVSVLLEAQPGDEGLRHQLQSLRDETLDEESRKRLEALLAEFPEE